MRVNLLFIKLKVIGDALLLTPTLTAVRKKYPQARISVLLRQGTQGILAGCPAIDRIYTTEAPEHEKRAGGSFRQHLALLRELRRQRFDWVFELGGNDRGRILGALAGGRKRAAGHDPLSTSRWSSLFRFPPNTAAERPHQVELDYFPVAHFLDLPTDEAPHLVFDSSGERPWNEKLTKQPFAVVHPATRKARKEWPAERWTEVIAGLRRDYASVVVSCGPDPVEVALGEQLCHAGGAGVTTTAGKASFGQLAWLLKRADLFVGVDTAAMHLAAACGCPTVAVWGPSDENRWRPWRCPHLLVTPAGAAGIPWKQRDIKQIEVVPVLEAIRSIETRALLRDDRR